MFNDNFYKGFFAFFVTKFRVSFLLIFLILVYGILSLITIPKESSPDIKIGLISIKTPYIGVNPIDIDRSITEKIEKEIKDIDGIKKIKSSSSVGFSSVIAELDNGVISRDVISDIREAIDNISLPEDAETPLISEISSSNELMFEVLLYGNRNKFDNFSLNSKAKKLQSLLEGKYGIVSINIGSADLKLRGGISDESDYELKVLLSKQKLESLGLNIGNISNIIRSNNKNTPIGNYIVGDLKYDFRFDGELANIEELKNIVIRGNGESFVKLGDIAEFKKEYKTDKTINYLGFYNQKDYNYISLVFNKEKGGSVFKTSKKAKEKLQEIIKNDKDFFGLELKYIKDMSELIKDDYKNLGSTAVTTIILVFITILLFVGFRESLIASFLLPLSFLITFIVLDILGLSLNFLTNFSLVLTLGIAIDTIIVIIEGASERLKLGYSRLNSILLAVYDLKAPLISGTLTTLSAFLPLMFLPGIMGKFLSYIPITVFSTLLAALILSLTVSSTLFLKLSRKQKTFHINESFENMLSEKEREYLAKDRQGKAKKTKNTLNIRERFLDFLGRRYFKLLLKMINSFRARLLSVILPIIFLLITFVLLSPKIGFTLFPATDEGVMDVFIKAKTGTDNSSLEKYVKVINNSLSSYPEVKVFKVSIRGNTIDLYIELFDKLERKEKSMRSLFEIERLVADDLKVLKSEGLKVEVETLKNGPPGVKAVGIKLIASNNKYLDTLKQVSDDFEEYLRGIPGTKNVSTSSEDNPGQFVFKFDKSKLDFVGLVPDDILREVFAYTSGLKAGSIKSEYEDNNIKLLVSDFDKNLSPDDINNLVITTKIGKIRVGDFADYKFMKSLSMINREDGKIIISVEADNTKDFLPSEIQPKLVEFAKNYNYPKGISFEAGGENEENNDLIISTIKSFFIALFLIFTILVFQFNSYSKPIIILYSVVLALLGVNIGLYLTGNPYSMPFGIGFIALTGVVVNDAIILVDRINKNVDRLERHKKDTLKKDYLIAVSSAGKSRLQPIIVTTLTTIFGVLPLAMQDEFWAGLGFTIIFGLFAGSFMTLFIIPSLYYQLFLRKRGR
ncbi:hypothetical protein CSB07_00070 [Candidatus Gracilibacteria bacterium]|nr:MAG: hypothetical protein CSB07_00070 [Candidatus Gracilibacteria bacterium]PIE85672.1 MAG: hypothetical protein CSA08_00815 [Candidatus Gracilibacteria bacterium]